MKGDCNSAVTLIKTEESAVNGVLTVTETEREVFCEILSSTASLKAEAGAAGMNHELKLKLSDINEYDGEKFFSFEQERFEISRTYLNGDMLEITGIRSIR